MAAQTTVIRAGAFGDQIGHRFSDGRGPSSWRFRIDLGPRSVSAVGVVYDKSGKVYRGTSLHDLTGKRLAWFGRVRGETRDQFVARLLLAADETVRRAA